MVGRLEGKVAIVTGAGSGIGRAVAIEFAKEAAQVVVNDRRTDGMGEETVTLIKTAGGDAIYVDADVAKEEEVERLIQKAVDTYGKLNVLVNNAGVATYKPLQELTEEDFDFVIATNQKGTFFGKKHAVPAMIAPPFTSFWPAMNQASSPARKWRWMAAFLPRATSYEGDNRAAGGDAPTVRMRASGWI